VGDAAKAGVVCDKHERLGEPHVAPLNALVSAWRAERGTTRIPWFDPSDGGVTARVLILMEAPAPGTVRATGSGICSEDNADPSNRQIAALRAAAAIPRAQCLKWNMVPWATHELGESIRAPARSEIVSAVPYLLQLLDVSRRVEVVVTLGNVATQGFMLATSTGAPSLYRVVSAPHPSQRNAGARVEALKRIARAFQLAAGHIGGDGLPSDREKRRRAGA
jgi:uracil-DNA glycosylase